jgi:hypothetical protein
MELEKN